MLQIIIANHDEIGIENHKWAFPQDKQSGEQILLCKSQ